MRKLTPCAVVLVGLLCVGLGWHAGRSREPVFQGKRLSAWLGDLPFGQPIETREQAREAVPQIGTNALPALLTLLGSRDSYLKLKLIELLGKQSFVKVHLRTAFDRRLLAHYGLEALGPTAKPALPALIEQLNHGDMAGQTADTLARVGGADALSPLTNALTHADKRVRYGVVLALGQLGAEAERVAPLLLKALADADPMMRQSAALALGELGQQSGVAVPALIEALGDTSPDVRRGAAQGLRGYSNLSEAKAAVPALLKLLDDGNPGVRSYAAGALKQIDPELAGKAGLP
jgi:HEAT repeat protein